MGVHNKFTDKTICYSFCKNVCKDTFFMEVKMNSIRCPRCKSEAKKMVLIARESKDGFVRVKTVVIALEELITL